MFSETPVAVGVRVAPLSEVQELSHLVCPHGVTEDTSTFELSTGTPPALLEIPILEVPRPPTTGDFYPMGQLPAGSFTMGSNDVGKG